MQVRKKDLISKEFKQNAIKVPQPVSRMPWESTNASNTTCTDDSDLQNYLDRMNKISNMNDQMFQDIGCIAPCTRREFYTKKIYHVEKGLHRRSLA